MLTITSVTSKYEVVNVINMVTQRCIYCMDMVALEIVDKFNFDSYKVFLGWLYIKNKNDETWNF